MQVYQNNWIANLSSISETIIEWWGLLHESADPDQCGSVCGLLESRLRLHGKSQIHIWTAHCVWRCNANAVQLLPRINAGCYLPASVTCAYMQLHANCCFQILQHTQLLTPRILDIIIRKDKTLVCAFEDNFKQNGVNIGQLLPAVGFQTCPKYNKHHHDLKNQLCRFIDM